MITEITDITYLIINLVRIYALYSFFDIFLKTRRASPGIFIMAYGFYYFISSFIYLNMFNPTLNIVMNLIMGFLMGLLYKAPNSRRLIATTFVYILSIASENCTAVALSLYFDISYSTAISGINIKLMGILISGVLFLVIVKMLSPLFNNQYFSLPKSYQLAVFLIPTGSIYIIHMLVNTATIDRSIEMYLIGFIIVILLSINILTFYLYNNLIREETVKYENILLAQQNEAYENQAMLIKEFQTGLSSQKHDLNNHLSLIKELAQMQQGNELIDYINTLIDTTNDTSPGINSGNIVIDAMVNSKLYMFNKENIKVCLSVSQIDNEININKADITTIIGNILDNALEAILRIDSGEKVIWISINHEHNVFTLEIINTYNISCIDIEDGKVSTTKNDKRAHGIGMTNIKNAVEKYNGIFEYETSVSGGMDIFTARVLLYT